MSKGDKFLIVVPIAALFAFAVFAIVGSYIVQRRAFEPPASPGSDQSFEQFATDVTSGKRQVASEDWIHKIRITRDAAEKHRQDGVTVIDCLRLFAWGALIVAVAQTFLIFSVSARYTKSAKTSPIEFKPNG